MATRMRKSVRGGSKKAKDFAKSEPIVHTRDTTVGTASPRWDFARTRNKRKEKRAHQKEGVSESLEAILIEFRPIITSDDRDAKFTIDRCPNPTVCRLNVWDPICRIARYAAEKITPYRNDFGRVIRWHMMPPGMIAMLGGVHSFSRGIGMGVRDLQRNPS